MHAFQTLLSAACFSFASTVMKNWRKSAPANLKKKKNLENCVRFEETAQHDSDSVILHV